MAKIYIGFTVDDGYVKYLAVTIASILCNANKSDELNFYVLNDGSISVENKSKINDLKKIKDFNIEWITVDTKLFENQGTNLREDITIATNYRFSLASLLPDIDKLIFLDADLILNADIANLWSIDVENYYMACSPVFEGVLDAYQQKLDIPLNYRYCNTGVMLCNLKKWREDNIEPFFFTNAKKYRDVCEFLDQDILNTVLYSKILYLDYKFNFIPDEELWYPEIYSKNLDKIPKNPEIIHWAGPRKPWNNTFVKYFEIYRKYAKRTKYFKSVYSNLDKQQKKIFLQNIFSVKNEFSNNKRYRVFTIFGIKFKFKRKDKLTKLLERKFDPNLSIEDKKYIISQEFEKNIGYKLDFNNPKTFNEKIQYLKLFYKDPKLTICSDKYRVRDYVKNLIGEKYLTPLIGVYDKADDIDFDSLPERFVVKVNWGSGQNIIVSDKSKIDVNDIKKKLNKWMEPHSNHYYHAFEWCYKDIEPKIIIEEYLETLDKSALDYKFLCFDGRPYFCWVSNKYLDVQERSFYDMNWEMQDIELVEPPKVKAKMPLPKPDNFDEMVDIAKTLCQGFIHVRVDLYKLSNGEIKFGELTFNTSSGFSPWAPVDVDKKLGDLINIDKLKME